MPQLPPLSALIAEIDDQAAPGEGELHRLADAERVADELAGLGARLVGYYVERLRAQGTSWAEIGASLGISKQAAQQRYAPPRFRLTVSDLVDTGVLVRLTERTRAALTRAERHAGRLGSATVDPQHLLLAILEDTDTLAVQALDTLSIDRNTLRAALETAENTAAPKHTGPLPLGGTARRVLETALHQALKLNHNYVGTEHVLLGLVRSTSEHDTVGQLFADRNVTYERAYDAVHAAINAYLQRR